MDRASGFAGRMRIGWAGLVSCALLPLAGCSEEADAAVQPAPILGFRDALASGNVDHIVRWIRYPLKRPYPLPPVRDEQDCRRRFAELFPKELIDAVANSKDEDWQKVGSRGITFGQGRLWVDAEQQLIGSNELAPQERARRNRLIEADRTSLAPSLQDFAEPVLRWQTQLYRLRIDKMADKSFRYASWRRGKPVNSEPDLVLQNGEYLADGTGGNHSYAWKHGQHLYACKVNALSNQKTPPLELVVSRGGLVLLREPALNIGSN